VGSKVLVLARQDVPRNDGGGMKTLREGSRKDPGS
jgi:hypothetical protein